MHTSTLIKLEKILNKPITKFHNSDDVNVIATELRLTKTRPTSFYKRHNFLQGTMPADVEFLKLNVKNRSVCMAYCELNYYTHAKNPDK